MQFNRYYEGGGTNMKERKCLKLAKDKNVDLGADDLPLVITMLMLREAFISVGHFFTRLVKSEIKFDFQKSLFGVYDGFRFMEHAEEAKVVGEKLFDYLLAQGKGGYEYDYFRLKYCLDDAGKVNPDATLLIYNFIQEWFSEKVIRMAQDEWEYYKKDEHFLSPFFGKIMVSGKLFVEKKLPSGAFSIFREGEINFSFNADGAGGGANWLIGKRDDSMPVSYSLPGWIRIEQKKVKNEVEVTLLFQFQSIFNFKQERMKSITVYGVSKKTGRVLSDWRATLNFGTVRGDLTFVPSLKSA